MLEAVRRRLPAPLKRRLRALVAPFLAAARRRTLRRRVRELRRAAAAGPVSAELLARVAAAWGNSGYIADMSFVSEVVARVQAGPGPFLDCGSGLTTIVAGAVADACGGRVWSLEQNARWHDEVRDMLAAVGIRSVELWHTPLRPYDDFAWFDLRGRTLPPAFSQVFCDGPAISRTRWPEPLYSAWRVGLVPVLRSLGVEFGEILLDDAEDRRSARLRTRWEALGVATRVVETPTGSWVHAVPARPRAESPPDSRAVPTE